MEKDEFERFGAVKAQIVDVGEGAKFGSEIEIGTGIGEKNSRVDEIGLAFLFIRTERREKAAGRSERNT